MPLPTRQDSAVQELLKADRIAIVGLSEGRISERIALFLQSQGREIVPVNPSHSQVMGLKSYPSLLDVPGRVDLVNVFRRPEFCEAIVADAIAVNAGGVWLQSGIVNERARAAAEAAGLPFVQDRCIMVEMAHV